MLNWIIGRIISGQSLWQRGEERQILSKQIKTRLPGSGKRKMGRFRVKIIAERVE